MARFEKWFTQDLSQRMETRHCESIVFTADNLSVLIGVNLFDNGTAADQTGSVVCYAIRSDENTVEFTGTISENQVSAILPQSCLISPGPVAVMLQVITGSGDDAVKTTVLKSVFTVEASTTGNIIDPGHVIPDVATLLAMIEQMEEGTAAANQAARDAEAAITDMETAVDNAIDELLTNAIFYRDTDGYVCEY